ncbi:MAG: indolepyruvate oxidoreductase subunit beta [Candidatus Auribacterota bacterium]|nr:indolepyruvate oxidoreductase subunit beta [Candidatus Auribacterota bacterium]
MTEKATSIILSGVGGQGVLLAARILSEAALRAGLDVKSSEVHGMSQRGGSVLAQVRFGPRVYSSLTPVGTGDFLVALEELEALRHRNLIRENGRIIVLKHRISPSTVTSGNAIYPEDTLSILKDEGFTVSAVEADEIIKLGNIRFANVFLLGVLAGQLEIRNDIWRDVITDSVPERFRDKNWRAFEIGREMD